MLRRLLLCTDLDRTLIPNGPQPESPNARHYLQALVQRPEVTLVFVSGRHLALVEQAIDEYQLPLPNFVIGDVGTTIYCVDSSGRWAGEATWEQWIAADWNGQSHDGLRDVLTCFEALTCQEAEKQNRFKLSYYLPGHKMTDELDLAIAQRLASVGVKARLIWSIDELKNTGLLDILPQRASKLHAIEWLMKREGYDLGNTVFCGDSGNDMEVLVSRVRSVLVANSHQEVRARAFELARKNSAEESLYIANGGFLGMNGNYSAGMLEGIGHYYPWVVDWMQQEAVFNEGDIS